GLQGAPFPLAPYELYLGSILANPYCLLTLLLIPLAIAWDYEPAAMRACRPVSMAPEESAATKPGRRRVVLVPLAVLSPAILLGFPLFCGTPVDMFSAAGWQTAFGGDGGPYALLVGSLLGLGAAWALFPRDRGIQPGEAASQGAGSLLPALLVLVLAWTLGSVLEALGASQQIAGWFSLAQSPFWLPLLVFVVGCGMSFVTGSSWGTMGLLTPLALSATLIAGKQAGLDPAALQTLSTMVIGAVFGGATFGDHCSPFSDTTIVSALASGCSTPAHVWTQLPFAALSAGCSLVAYSGMASGLAAWQATGLAAILMVLWLQAARTRAFTRT
ncbi:MAG: Na+/H+ antiporter NhaC family protein, partial [Candidatus Sericytochromatia bacterium]|nr:Na+/H+ antiporter NhaC family protein [Candidatus Sericytochromatia bacterium]